MRFSRRPEKNTRLLRMTVKPDEIATSSDRNTGLFRMTESQQDTYLNASFKAFSITPMGASKPVNKRKLSAP
jgi:hypothetical protein